jgi:hypothetical protein
MPVQYTRVEFLKYYELGKPSLRTYSPGDIVYLREWLADKLIAEGIAMLAEEAKT